MTNQSRESSVADPRRKGTCQLSGLSHRENAATAHNGEACVVFKPSVADPPKVSETRTLEPNQDLSSVPKATGNSVIGASQDSIVADRPGTKVQTAMTPERVADGFTKEMKAWRCSCGAETGSVREPSFCSYCGRGFAKQGVGAQ